MIKGEAMPLYGFRYVPYSVIGFGTLLLYLILVVSNLQRISPLVVAAFFSFLSVASLLLYREQRSGESLLAPTVFFVLYHVFLKDIWPSLVVAVEGFSYHAALSTLSKYELDYVLVKKFLIWIAALLAFVVGASTSKMIRLNFELPVINYRRATVVFITLTFFTVVVFVLYANAVGGVSDLLLERGRAREDRYSSQVGGHYAFLLYAGVLSAYFYMAFGFWRRQKILFFSCFSISLILVFLATGSRAILIIAMIIAIMIFYREVGRLPILKLMLAGVVSLAIIGIGGEYRAAQRGAQDLGDITLGSGFLGGVVDGFSEFASRSTSTSGELGIYGRIPSQLDFIYGSSYLAFIVTPVPRFLWNDKPRAGGHQTAVYVFDRPDTAIPPGGVGELYMNFGLIGVVVGMLITGFLYKVVFNTAEFYKTPATFLMMLVFYVYFLPATESMNFWIRLTVLLVIINLAYAGLPKFIRRV